MSQEHRRGVLRPFPLRKVRSQHLTQTIEFWGFASGRLGWKQMRSTRRTSLKALIPFLRQGENLNTPQRYGSKGMSNIYDGGVLLKTSTPHYRDTVLLPCRAGATVEEHLSKWGKSKYCRAICIFTENKWIGNNLPWSMTFLAYRALEAKIYWSK